MNHSIRSSKNAFLRALIYVLLFLLIALVLFAAGLMIGYSVIGGGGDPLAVFTREVWQKIIDFVS